MLGWLTESLDVATTKQALQALATVAVSAKAYMAAAMLGLTGLVVLVSSRGGRRNRAASSRETDLARAVAAYGARLPNYATRMTFELANIEAAMLALEARRKSLGKNQRPAIQAALHMAAAGNFEPARAIFEDIVNKEGARWRLQRPKMAAALRHMGTCARIDDSDAARAAFVHASTLEPTNETALTMQAELALEAGQATDAEPVLGRLISLADRDSDPHALVYGLVLRGDCRAMQGRLAAAATDYQRACEICRAQPDADEATLDWKRLWALAYGSLGEVLLRQRKHEEAREHFEGARDIQQELARAAPDNIDVLRDLAASYDRIGDLHLAAGDTAAALATFVELRNIGKRLTESHPDHAELQRDFAVACSRLGEVLRSVRRLPEALDAFRDDLAISARLADAAPDDEGRQRDLAVSYTHVGDVLFALGHPQDALVSFEAAETILKHLHQALAEDEAREHELALLRTRIGAAHAKLNANAKALEAFSAVVTNATKRAAATPNDISRQRELAQIHTRIGGLHLDTGDLESAVTSFEAARKIVERIPEDERASAELRREHALCHGRIALARARSDARDDALAAFQAGHNLLASVNGGSEVLVAGDKAWFAGQIEALEVTQTFTLQPLKPVEPAAASPEAAPLAEAVTVR